jgi:peptidoglycan/xylan/chitin deacetylase (PgdA/CDA1 family)
MTGIAYLTIDDSPSPDFMNKLDFLDARGIRAVWFCQGNYMEQRPQMIIDALLRGHIIANHSYSHPHFSEISIDQAFAEIRATDAVLDELYQRSGVERAHRFFRFPYGDKGDGHNTSPLEQMDAEGQARYDAIQAYLKKLGYTPAALPGITYSFYNNVRLGEALDWYWTYDTHDWALIVDDPPDGLTSTEAILARMDEDAPENWRGLNDPGSTDIILTHDHAQVPHIFTAESERLLAQGLHFEMPL